MDVPAIPDSNNPGEYTGGQASYWLVTVHQPIRGPAYTAECLDLIEALDMNFAEGEAFKAIWRRAAARTLGLKKKGYTDGYYDAEKVAFFGGRMLAMESNHESQD